MIEIRPFAQLGAANHGWLDAKHHFSPSPNTTTRNACTGAAYGSGMTTPSHPKAAFPRTPIMTWKSSRTCGKAPSAIRTA